MLCKKCGAEINEGSKFCGKCGAEVTPDVGTAEKPSVSLNIKSDKRKVPVWVIGVVAVAVIGIIAIIGFISVSGFHLKHEWTEATCTEPRTCVAGGETEGDPFGHTWMEASCTKPKTCSVCGETEGKALGHEWIEATCADARTCSVCGETEGKALGHNWIDATCTEPETCKVCGETQGQPAGHTWEEATCLVPAACTKCGVTEGGIGDHKYDSEYKCIYCGKIGAIELTRDNYSDYLIITHTGSSISVRSRGNYTFIDCIVGGSYVYNSINMGGVLAGSGMNWSLSLDSDGNASGNFYQLTSGIDIGIGKISGYVVIE